MASSPQHPYVSTATGMQTQPKQLHFALLVAFLQASAADTVDPAITLVSFKVVGFSGDVTVKSNAANLPSSQFWTRMSAGQIFYPLRLGYCLLQVVPRYKIPRMCLTEHCALQLGLRHFYTCPESVMTPGDLGHVKDRGNNWHFGRCPFQATI